jgi:homocysteine S-methyltransferase
LANSRIDIWKKHSAINRPFILDGAVGSELIKRNIVPDKYLWTSNANLYFPEKVLELHEEYIKNGAEIITTNTFRTNPTAVFNSHENIFIDELVNKSVRLAIYARQDKEILIAGSNAPAEDCYQSNRTISVNELEYNHKKHIELLWNNGCDIIWNETQGHFDEIEIICKYCSENYLPYVINLFFTDEMKILSGQPLNEVILQIKEYSPLAIGFNCIKNNLLDEFLNHNIMDYPWGFYLNCGYNEIQDENIECIISPSDYSELSTKYLTNNPLYVGSCCGSNPLHTKAIQEKFSKFYGN